MRYAGGCACGAVRYEVAAEPVFAGQCQCRDCQRATGTGHADVMVFPRSAVVSSGELKYHDVRGDSGNTVRRGFCPACGSPVMWTFSRLPDLTAIMVGSLDDPSLFGPQAILYTSSGLAWDHVDPALPKFAKLPPSQG